MSKLESLNQLRRLLAFLDEYGTQHPEFAQALAEALDQPYKAPKKKAATKPAVDPIEFVTQHGFDAYTQHLQGATDEEVRLHAKALKVRALKKDPVDQVRESVLTRISKQVGRGSAFSKRT